MKAELILENGMRFEGIGFGAKKDVVGEIIFTTNVGGYQENITDPSYAGQIVTMTFPLLGCYGANSFDSESYKPSVRAIVAREKCDFPSNFRCEMSVDEFLNKQGIVGIYGIDTRALTRILRDNGTMKAVIAFDEISFDDAKAKMDGFSDVGLVDEVTCEETYVFSPQGDVNVAVIDLGVKESVLSDFSERKCKVTVFTAHSKADEILSVNPDVVFVSAGPGNPSNLTDTIETVKTLLGKVKVCGSCLGQLVIALALGCEVKKLSFGHHGANYPVKDMQTGRVFITAQNSNYVVSRLADGVELTYNNVNDGTIAGFRCAEKNAEAVLFRPHSEAKVYGDGFIYDRFIGKEVE